MSLLALIGVMNSELAEAYPVASTPTVATTFGGSCDGSTVASPATLRVSWTVTNVDGLNFTVTLYENNISKGTIPMSAGMHWDKTISGAVVNGPSMPWNANWTYRVDITDNASGVVVSSKSSAAWTQAYGGCRSGGGL